VTAETDRPPVAMASSEIPQVKHVVLRWTGEGLSFRGGKPGGAQVPVDGDSRHGPSPMDTLLLALAGCMGSDVVAILGKSRVPLTALSVEVEGSRAVSDPRRYTRIRLVYHLEGPGDEHRTKVQRAVDLSRETYCSVLHSLRPDIEVEVEVGGL